MRNTFFLIIFFLAGASSFDAHGSEENSKDALPFSADELETCLALESDRIKCYVSLCDNIPSYVCAENILDAIVAVTGPEKGMMELHDIMQNPEFAISTDGHLLAHVIGRSLSKNHGPTGKNFLQCPPDFNNGCFHGFFEDTLVKVNDPVAVATDICESLPEEHPERKNGTAITVQATCL